MKEDPRFPHTYACDFIRAIAGYNKGGTKLSRSDASRIIGTIAELAGLDNHELCETLARAEMAKTDEDRNAEAKRALAEMGFTL
jgi:hypothetical protein